MQYAVQAPSILLRIGFRGGVWVRFHGMGDLTAQRQGCDQARTGQRVVPELALRVKATE